MCIFSKPFEEPIRIISLYDNGANLKSIDKSKSKVIRVALNRMRKCPKGNALLRGKEFGDR